MSRSNDKQTLIRIGLIVIGLMMGILLTMWFGGTGMSGTARPGVVERVELGSAPGSGYVAVPESDIPLAYLDALSLNEVFKDVSSRVTPTVVFIQVVSGVTGNSIFRQFGSENGRGSSQSLGSGVIIDDNGYIVTNNHVVEGANSIFVTLGDKREFEARVIGRDPTTDLAVIKIDPESPVPVIALGDANSVEVGEWVLAVGNPFRLTSTVTAGIVSAIGRQVDVIDNQLGIESFIQTDAAINPGNSGGALVNLRGELVGIATAIATESGSYEGYGFAVPVDLMERVVRDLIRFGEVRRGYLGVSITPMDAARAEALGLSEVQGVYLQDVHRGLAGELSGLRSGDVLLTIDGRSMTEPNELQSAIALFSPGDVVPVEIWRNGQVRDFDVTLKGRESPGYENWLSDLGRQNQLNPLPSLPDSEIPDESTVQFEEWGVGLADLDGRLRRQYQLMHGVFVAVVTKDGLFDQAGISRGMIITHVDDTPVFNIDAMRAQLKDQTTVLIQAQRSDRTIVFFEIERETP
ncbi:MAG: trypsin-like peptidase domain-containing protein [Rhodothermales bacterium]|nr:trypsin-like peptidase domain-containing protein [Rhodothermales bacterium]MDG2016273.1 trypsin-like peptidase domain-containing protein [Rhodothermales bacterium]